MLDDEQKIRFRDKVYAKYGINVSISQIHVLAPTNVTCEIELDCNENETVRV